MDGLDLWTGAKHNDDGQPDFSRDKDVSQNASCQDGIFGLRETRGLRKSLQPRHQAIARRSLLSKWPIEDGFETILPQSYDRKDNRT
jgi:hypothetical protein